MLNRELLKSNFEKHGFQTSFFATKEEAANYMVSTIEGKRIAFGGSVTAQQLELSDKLSKQNEIIWHWSLPGKETLKAARDAEVYITSANGVSETGELINIDGTGNRVAQTLYGPEKVYFVVGSNKIEPDMHSAIQRAKNVAAPQNAVRLGFKTPCAANGGDRCYDCDSPERICRATVILERPTKGVAAEVVFVDETLGY